MSVTKVSVPTNSTAAFAPLPIAGISLKSVFFFDNPDYCQLLCKAILFWMNEFMINSRLA
jgi:hypothetical protein